VRRAGMRVRTSAPHPNHCIAAPASGFREECRMCDCVRGGVRCRVVVDRCICDSTCGRREYSSSFDTAGPTPSIEQAGPTTASTGPIVSPIAVESGAPAVLGDPAAGDVYPRSRLSSQGSDGPMAGWGAGVHAAQGSSGGEVSKSKCTLN
jgi:hypothetical protein